MEKAQLIEVIKLYKQQLADAMEEKMVFQVLLNMQAKQIQEMEQQIQNLNAQLNEMNYNN
jgi:hypothetical protein